MTVILVLATFTIFILLDWAINRRKAPQVPRRPSAGTRPSQPLYVEGFLVPEELSYHPGHSWAVSERRNLVRIGMDEFAAALAGHVDASNCPSRANGSGRAKRPGRCSATARRPRWYRPPKVKSWKSTARFYRTRACCARTPTARAGWPWSTFPTRRARPGIWFRRGWSELGCGKPSAGSTRFNPLAGAVAADGGLPTEDLLRALPDADWKAVTGEFFLTA